jgi:hypothetical protein
VSAWATACGGHAATSPNGTLRQAPDEGYRIIPTVAGRGWLTEPIISHLSLDDVGPASGHVRYGEVLLTCCHR